VKATTEQKSEFMEKIRMVREGGEWRLSLGNGRP
jgi:hypothetical protein